MPEGLQSPIFSCHNLKCFWSDVSVHLSVVWHQNSFLSVSERAANLVEELMNNTAVWKRNLVQVLGIRHNKAR